MEDLTKDFKIINCRKYREPYYWRSTGAPSAEQLLEMPQGFPYPPLEPRFFFQQPAKIHVQQGPRSHALVLLVLQALLLELLHQ
jgi:hypothetical protein